MAGAGGVGSRPLHDPVPREVGPRVEDHVEIGVEPAGRHQHGAAIDDDFIAALDVPPGEPGGAAGLAADAGDLGVRDDLAAARTIGLDQPFGELPAVAARPGPAHHRVALLRLHVGPRDAEPLGPEIEVVERVLDIVARPDGIGRLPAPAHPVREGEVGAVLDPPLALQRRIHDQAAAARDDRRAARIGGHLEGDGARAGVARLDPGRHPRAAGPDDRHIRLETPDTHCRPPRRFAPGGGAFSTPRAVETAAPAP